MLNVDTCEYWTILKYSTMEYTTIQCGAPKIAKFVYNFVNSGLWWI